VDRVYHFIISVSSLIGDTTCTTLLCTATSGSHASGEFSGRQGGRDSGVQALLGDSKKSVNLLLLCDKFHKNKGTRELRAMYIAMMRAMEGQRRKEERMRIHEQTVCVISTGKSCDEIGGCEPWLAYRYLYSQI
jgi:hypothetical protein